MIPAQTWETNEEATAALHEYARQFAERTENESDHQRFLDGHFVIELAPGVYSVALAQGESPFTFS